MGLTNNITPVIITNGGRLLQSIQTNLTATQNIALSANTWAEATNMATSITPYSAGSRIQIRVSICMQSGAIEQLMMRVKRGTTVIASPQFSNLRLTGSTSQYATGTARWYFVGQLLIIDDMPLTTSSTTYHFEFLELTAHTCNIGQSDTDTSSSAFWRAPTNIILQEYI